MSDHLTAHRQADTARRRKSVQASLRHLVEAGTFVTVAAVAEHAGVHRSFIYRHQDLRAEIAATFAIRRPPTIRDDQITSASLAVTVENERARNRRLARQVSQLEARLSEFIGHESVQDIAAGDSMQMLQERITELEQLNLGLRRQLDEAATELEAAQHVNQLTRQINRTSPCRHEPRA